MIVIVMIGAEHGWVLVYSWLARQVQNAGLSKGRLVLDYKFWNKKKLLWCCVIVWSVSFLLTNSFLLRQNLLIRVCKANAAQGLDFRLFVLTARHSHFSCYFILLHLPATFKSDHLTPRLLVLSIVCIYSNGIH